MSLAQGMTPKSEAVNQLYFSFAIQVVDPKVTSEIF
jgi:hypothetical protein